MENGFLRISINSIEFPDIESNINYVYRFTIQNIHYKIVQYHLVVPTTKYFKVIPIMDEKEAPGNPTRKIASGMIEKYDVRFKTEDIKMSMYEDQILIQSDHGEKLRIDLKASTPKGDLIFPKFIDFGNIIVNKKVLKHISMRNIGTEACNFNFLLEEETEKQLIVTPLEGKLEANKIREIRMELTNKELKKYSQLVSLKICNGVNEEERKIDIQAMPVEHHLKLLQSDGNEEVGDLDFGSIYFGQSITLKWKIINNGPAEATYNFTMTYDDDESMESNKRHEDTTDVNNTEKELLLAPVDGFLREYEEQQITLTYKPIKASPGEKQSKSMKINKLLNVQLHLTSQETSDDIVINVKGKAVSPSLTLSENVLAFGDCVSGERNDISITITNTGELKFFFSIAKVIPFSCYPNKGCLEPMQSQNIIVGFTPKHLGEYKNTMTIRIDKTEMEYRLALHGHCNELAKSRTVKQQQKILPEDFLPNFNLIPNAASTLTLCSEESSVELIRENDCSTINRNIERTYTPEFGNRSRRRRRKTLSTTKTEEWDDPTNMGIDPHGGLRPPVPVLSKSLEPLWMDTRSRALCGGRSFKALNDDTQLIKKKFPSTPSTKIETKDCSALLTTKDLKQIQFGNCDLSYGNVCVGSTSKKSFTIYNPLDQYVLIQLQIPKDCEELSQTSPLSQVVPPGSIAGFDVVFNSKHEGEYIKSIPYIINSKHVFKLNIQASVVPIRLEISKAKLDFIFPDSSLTPSLEETFELRNPGNSVVKYRWKEDLKGKQSAFQISPYNGELGPYANCMAKILYTPTYGVGNTTTFSLDIENSAESKQLVCTCAYPDPKYVVKEKKIVFGTIATGIAKSKTLVIENLGDASIAYYIDCPSEASDLTVTPTEGIIARQSKREIDLRLLSEKPGNLDVSLVFRVRGGKSTKINVNALLIVPVIQMKEDEVTFPSVTVHSTCTKKLTVVNDGEIDVGLLLDLSTYSPTFWISPIAGQTTGVEMIPLLEREPNNETSSNTIKKDDRTPKWNIFMPSKTMFSFLLNFSPEEKANYSFRLPLLLSGSSFLPFKQTLVIAESLNARLRLSPSEVTFGNIVVSRNDGPKIATSKEVKLTNTHDSTLHWSLDANVLKSAQHGAFHIGGPTNGVLAPNESCVLKINFLPSRAQEYSLVIPLALENEPYMSLSILGAGIYPYLSFNEKSIHLPIVPLGIQSRTTFTVYGFGYDSLELDYHILINTKKTPVELYFPQGKSLNAAVSQIPVEVRFSCTKPLAFSTTVEFFDTYGSTFRLPISGATDNSVLSTYEFVRTHKDEFGIFSYAPIVPPFLLETSQVKDIRRKLDGIKDPQISKTLDTLREECDIAKDASQSSEKKSKGKEDTKQRFATLLDVNLEWKGKCLRLCSLAENDIKTDNNVLIKLLNATVLTSPITAIPEDFILGNGRPIYDMLENLCSKQVPGRLGKVSSNPRERCKQLISQYNDLLKFLKSFGAMLPDITAESLLEKTDYIYYKQDPESPQDTPSSSTQQPRRQIDVEWHVISRHSWRKIIYQILRLFLLGRISIDAHNDSAEETTDLKFLRDSNIYSESESILVHWINSRINMVSIPGKARVLTNFEEDIKDGTIIARLLSSYIPDLCNDGHALKSFHYTPSSETDITQNFLMIKRSLVEIENDCGLSEEMLSSLSCQQSVLFFVYLYQTLPMYIPRGTIEFNGQLGTVIKKSVEMQNPTKQSITYKVSLSGSSDFSISAETLVLSPSGKESVIVELRPRFTKVIEGRLAFRSIEQNPCKSTLFIYNLKSSIESRKASKSIKMEGITYEQKVIEINIENPFPQTGNFRVACTHEVPKQPSASKSKSKWSEFIDEKNWCYIKNDLLTLRPGGSANMNVVYHPLKPGVQQFQLVFIDDNIGEFMYELVGTAALPKVIETIKFSSEMKQFITKDIIISPMNINLLKNAQIISDRASTGTASGKSREAIKKFEDEGKLVFKAEVTSPFWSVPTSDITVSSSQERAKGLSPTFVTATLRPKAPGVYPCQMILKSGYDVRVYELEATVRPPTARATLEFVAPARQVIVQDIPITNNSEEVWRLHATITGSSKFSGPNSLAVNPKSTASYHLKFQPSWVGNETALLEIANDETEERIEYELLGRAEDPLKEGNIVLNCKAGEIIEKVIEIKNFSKSSNVTRLEIESDVPCITGLNTIEISGERNANYILTFSPLYSGSYIGSITFKNPETKEFAWYTIEAEVAKRDPESSLVIKTMIRQTTVVEVTLSNPLSETILFLVDMQGDGLLGKNVFQLKGNSTSTYELAFCPLFPKEETDASITFSNEKVGEFWYMLHLIALPTEVVELQKMTCPVGASCVQPITIRNPRDTVAMLRHDISNTRNYSIHNKEIVLQPLQTYNAILEYTPSSMSEAENADIILTSETLGEWKFHVSGIGMPPTVMKALEIISQVNQMATAIHHFKNPFSKPLEIKISVQTDHNIDEGFSKVEENRAIEECAFQIINKKRTINIREFSVAEIHLAFTPTQMTEYHAVLYVKAAAGMEWKYPLKGIAEVVASSTPIMLTCRARDGVERDIHVELSGLKQQEPNEKFDFVLDIPPKFKNLVERSLVIKPVVSRPTPGSIPALEYHARFDPLKPFSTVVDLYIKKNCGGQWKLPLELLALDPPIDDTILLEAAVNQTTSVSFRLTNLFNESTPFRANFSLDSSSSFTIFPSEGTLEPYGGQGTQFILCFSPTSYGKPASGKLIITTEEIQWTYIVKGTHPKYKVPEGRPRVDSI